MHGHVPLQNTSRYNLSTDYPQVKSQIHKRSTIDRNSNHPNIHQPPSSFDSLSCTFEKVEALKPRKAGPSKAKPLSNLVPYSFTGNSFSFRLRAQRLTGSLRRLGFKLGIPGKQDMKTRCKNNHEKTETL